MSGEATSSLALSEGCACAAAERRKTTKARMRLMVRSVQRAREGAPAQLVRGLGLLVDEVEERGGNLAEEMLGVGERRGRDVGEIQLAFQLPRDPLAGQGIEP